MAKLIDSLIHWKKKLERTTDSDVICDVIRKLQRIPMTIELLQETGIGKIIRILRKHEGKVGEKASVLLQSWRDVVSSSQKLPEKSSKDVSPVKTDKKLGSKYSNDFKTNHSASVTDKHSSSKKKDVNKISNSHQRSIDEDKSSKYNALSESTKVQSNGCDYSFEKTFSSPYSYKKNESSASYMDYDLNRDFNESYNPDHPELFPSRDKLSHKNNSNIITSKRKTAIESLDIMEGMFRVKKVKSENGDLYKTSEINGNSQASVKDRPLRKAEDHDKSIRNHDSSNRLKTQKEKFHSSISNDHVLEKDNLNDVSDLNNVHYKKNRHSSPVTVEDKVLNYDKYRKNSLGKEESKNLTVNDRQSFHSENNSETVKNGLKGKHLKLNKVNNSDSAKSKMKVDTAEEFTASEVSFETCLGFNDIVKKKKKKSTKTLIPTSQKDIKVNIKSDVKNSEAATINSQAKNSETTKIKSKIKSSETTKIKSSAKHAEVSKKKLNAKNSEDNKAKSEEKSQHSKKSSKKQSNNNATDFKLAEVDILSTLPEIQPNYRPLPQRDCDGFINKKKAMSNEEAIMFTSSKKEKTAVYSGRRNCFLTEVPTLYESCVRIIVENVDYLTYTGNVPYFLLKPILERCTADQLFSVEYYNAYLVEDTNELWEKHCKRVFRSKMPDENETWREMYWRLTEEQKRKLKSITANISASMSKYNPARKVKLTYMDSVVKPPRDVARKQAKHGTGLPVSHPMRAEPPSKASPRPVAPTINAAATSAISQPFIPKKPKVAPLMAKTLKSMKQCFRR